jgi:hypothetical protein
MGQNQRLLIDFKLKLDSSFFVSSLNKRDDGYSLKGFYHCWKRSWNEAVPDEARLVIAGKLSHLCPPNLMPVSTDITIKA